MQISPNISRSNFNQTMKFGQLIKYNIKTSFLKNRTQNVVEKLAPDPFLKIRNWAYFWINSLNFYAVCFYCKSKSGNCRDILKPKCRPLALTSCKAFLIDKERPGTSLPASFSPLFFKEQYFSCYVQVNWPNFIFWLPLLLEILGNMCIVTNYFSVHEVTNFEMNLSSLNKLFSYMTKISMF